MKLENEKLKRGGHGMDARTEFGQLVQQVTSFVGDRDLDAALATLMMPSATVRRCMSRLRG